MIRDPAIGWDTPFPYEALAPAGVTWRTGHAQLQQVPFALMRRRMMTTAAQRAWDELRTPRNRMLVDLFLYDVDDDLGDDLGDGLDDDLDDGMDDDADRDTAEPGDPHETPQHHPGAVPDHVATLCDVLIRFDR